MKKVKTVSFQYAPCEISRPYNAGPPQDNKFEKYRYISETMTSIMRIALKSQQFEPIPYFEQLIIRLSSNPTCKLDLFKKRFLTTEVKYNPQDALRTDFSEQELGEKFIAYVEEGLDNVTSQYRFDRSAFDRGLMAYRESKYTASFRVAKGKFPSTKTSYEVYGEMGPSHSAAEIVINPGKDTEKAVEFWRENRPTMLGATGYNTVELLDEHIEISHGTWRVFEPVRIARSEFGV